MSFFKRNAGYVVPVLFAFLSAMNMWEAIHSGRFFQYMAAVGFGGAAILFYISQRRIYKNSQKSSDQASASEGK